MNKKISINNIKVITGLAHMEKLKIKLLLREYYLSLWK